METRANFVLIGAFTLAVIASGFLFVLWLVAAGQVSHSRTYEVLFTGSVSGLSRGGSVVFNGLRVGEVLSIDFVPNDPGRVAAIINVDGRITIKKDTQARLELQGLTGGSAIALTGGAGRPERRDEQRFQDSRPPDHAHTLAQSGNDKRAADVSGKSAHQPDRRDQRQDAYTGEHHSPSESGADDRTERNT